MIPITILCLGKLKEPYLRDAAAEYQKRLGAFCRLQITELTPERLPDAPSDAQIAAALEREAAALDAKIPSGAAVVALCIEGEQMDSVKFSRKLEDLAVRGFGGVVFVIGSSYGLSPRIKQKAQLRLSMSAMTFPHQLARVMLLEQLYRAAQIAGGGKYHK